MVSRLPCQGLDQQGLVIGTVRLPLELAFVCKLGRGPHQTASLLALQYLTSQTPELKEINVNLKGGGRI